MQTCMQMCIHKCAYTASDWIQMSGAEFLQWVTSPFSNISVAIRGSQLTTWTYWMAFPSLKCSALMARDCSAMRLLRQRMWKWAVQTGGNMHTCICHQTWPLTPLKALRMWWRSCRTALQQWHLDLELYTGQCDSESLNANVLPHSKTLKELTD